MKIFKVTMTWMLRIMCLFVMLQIPSMQAHAGSGGIIDEIEFQFWDASGTNKIEDNKNNPVEVEQGETVTVKLKIKDQKGADDKSINKNDYNDVISNGEIKEQDNTFVCEEINWPDAGTIFKDDDSTVSEIPITIQVKKDAKVNTEASIAVKKNEESGKGKSGNLHIKVIESPKDPTPTSNESSHTHNFTWVTVREATTQQDGLEEYRCDCGLVQESSVIPSSQVYVKGLYGKLRDAAVNGQVYYDSGRLYTISDYLIKKMQERSDVTTVINFEYDHKPYKMTIPAGLDYTGLLEDQDYFYGYFYFAKEVGAIIE